MHIRIRSWARSMTVPLRDAGSRKRTMVTRVVAVVCLVLAVSVAAAWAQRTFSDVPEDHPQAADIAYAVEKGWFAGYDDGTFRPDNTLIDRHVVVVFRRAFPVGVTRADLATILRAGDEVLNPTGTTAGSTDQACWHDLALCIEDEYLIPDDSSPRYAIRFRTLRECPDSWYIEVQLTDENDRRTGDWGNEAIWDSVPAGHTMTVEVNYDQDFAAYEIENNCR